ncbi:MAG: hypothetical protein IJT94_02595 [Oscillibacter sp.]|nr:hypothetical protein [Oscillibacter sp.]
MEGYWDLFYRTGNPLACLLFLQTQDAGEQQEWAHGFSPCFQQGVETKAK